MYLAQIVPIGQAQAEDELQGARAAVAVEVEQQRAVVESVYKSAAGGIGERVVPGVGPEQLAVALAEPGDGVVIQLVFSDRCQIQRLDPLGAALAQGVEGADVVDFVAEHVDAVRGLRARRKNVDDAAPQRIVAGLVDGAYTGVAVAVEKAR